MTLVNTSSSIFLVFTKSLLQLTYPVAGVFVTLNTNFEHLKKKVSTMSKLNNFEDMFESINTLKAQVSLLLFIVC